MKLMKKMTLICLLLPQILIISSCTEIFNKNKPESVRAKHGGSPYYAPSMKVKFVCALGDYRIRKSEAACEVERQMEGKGFYCGNYTQEGCFNYFQDNAPNAEACKFLASMTSMGGFLAKCLSRFGGTPLAANLCSSAFKQGNIIEIAKGKCVDVEKAKWRNVKGQSILHLAALYLATSKGGFAVQDLRYIARNVDDVNAVDSFGNTALHYANDIALNWIFRLIKPKANTKLLNKDSESILVSIFKNGYRPLASDVEELVDSGLNINAQDKFGKTALHYLAKIEVPPSWPRDYLSKLRAKMISLGADPTIKDNMGNLPQ